MCACLFLAHCTAQDLTTFSFLLTSLDIGLKSLDVAISSSCAAALDAIAGFYFRKCVLVSGHCVCVCVCVCARAMCVIVGFVRMLAAKYSCCN